ncbi:hypothetical protein NSK_002270 [Nannochloropsis salina CCMP1776]|uniref:Uncharacterized protein n=1 Tax=Nannochloropsis salina CCMP1776 TaxID=1027361 RepID=A0A4D9D5G7_9STRA|nr:hypothetical protein NSK_002270 [Nannochloropsis salina CCMP1776]|eukprot:TFJ86616.1 hypothetical protein NSK_002270 [Nannochloropsis salina CCMP1776]
MLCVHISIFRDFEKACIKRGNVARLGNFFFPTPCRSPCKFPPLRLAANLSDLTDWRQFEPLRLAGLRLSGAACRDSVVRERRQSRDIESRGAHTISLLHVKGIFVMPAVATEAFM